MKQQERQRLGNYWITGFLGRGGFAQVYLGEHISLHRLAAIKVLNGRPPSEKLERFWTEASITAELPHRHIVQIFDKDETTIYATILAIPNYRLKATDQTVIKFSERPAGQPEALRACLPVQRCPSPRSCPHPI